MKAFLLLTVGSFIPVMGLAVAVLVFVASIAGPVLVRKNIMKQPHAADQ